MWPRPTADREPKSVQMQEGQWLAQGFFLLIAVWPGSSHLPCLWPGSSWETRPSQCQLPRTVLRPKGSSPGTLLKSLHVGSLIRDVVSSPLVQSQKAGQGSPGTSKTQGSATRSKTGCASGDSAPDPSPHPRGHAAPPPPSHASSLPGPLQSWGNSPALWGYQWFPLFLS